MHKVAIHWLLKEKDAATEKKLEGTRASLESQLDEIHKRPDDLYDKISAVVANEGLELTLEQAMLLLRISNEWVFRQKYLLAWT